MSNFKFRPRLDYVIIQIVDVGETESGIALPQVSVQGKQFVVKAIGPDVKADFKVGDFVLMLGSKNITYFEIPTAKDLIVIKQEFIVLVIE